MCEGLLWKWNNKNPTQKFFSEYRYKVNKKFLKFGNSEIEKQNFHCSKSKTLHIMLMLIKYWYMTSFLRKNGKMVLSIWSASKNVKTFNNVHYVSRSKNEWIYHENSFKEIIAWDIVTWYAVFMFMGYLWLRLRDIGSFCQHRRYHF